MQKDPLPPTSPGLGMSACFLLLCTLSLPSQVSPLKSCGPFYLALTQLRKIPKTRLFYTLESQGEVQNSRFFITRKVLGEGGISS